MSDEHSEMEPEAAPGGKAGKSKEKRQRAPRTHGDRALASLRAANRAQREITEPAERLRLQLAEANVLALLDLADAIRGRNGAAHAPAEATSATE